MNALRAAILVILVGGAAACAEAPTASDGILKVTTDASALQLANLSPAPVHYQVFERETLALVDWVACTGGPPCPTLAAGGTVSVPYSAIFGYTLAAQEGVVYWWRDVSNRTGFAPFDSVHSLVVSLRPKVWPGVTAP